MKRFGTVFAFAMVLIFSTVILGGIAFAAVSEQKSSSAETFSSKDIQEDDSIYFKVEKYDVSLNPPLLPYFLPREPQALLLSVLSRRRP